MAAPANANANILIVDDSAEDYETTVRALRVAKLANPVGWCRDGDDALDYLYRRGRYQDVDTPRPAVILLDLNLPGTDGREVLAEVKQDESLKLIPVIVLTSSSDSRDIAACYAAGANSYMQKPVSFDGFVEAIRRMTGFWFEIAILPGTVDP